MFSSPQKQSPKHEARTRPEPTKIRPDPPLCNRMKCKIPAIHFTSSLNYIRTSIMVFVTWFGCRCNRTRHLMSRSTSRPLMSRSTSRHLMSRSTSRPLMSRSTSRHLMSRSTSRHLMSGCSSRNKTKCHFWLPHVVVCKHWVSIDQGCQTFLDTIYQNGDI
jgi:hypothetical protein